MHCNFTKFSSFVVFLLAVIGLASVAPAQEKRAALVIGNGAYVGVPALANPPNDAADMAAMLRDAGFEVIERENLDLPGMDQALADFGKLLVGKDTALFFYAGHGVQVQGENYLIPVKEDIRSEAQARSRGIAVADVLDRVRQGGAKTALVFLDACRDNPFPGASRSGTRGLSVVAAPRQLETMIAYATEPGDTAADGNGRNGVFTAALLKALAVPGQKLSDGMTQVKAIVKDATAGKQRPRVDDGLTTSFYLIDPAQVAARAQAASQKAAAELAALDKQLAERQAKIAAAKDQASKDALETEQKKQQAIQAAKKLEADNLAREAERQQQAAAAAQNAALRKQADDAAARQRQDELAKLAAAKRQQLDQIQGSGDDPDALMNRVEQLDAALKDIQKSFDAVWVKTKSDLDRSLAGRRQDIDNLKPEVWESDDEFKVRVAGELKKLDAEVEASRASLQAEQKRQTAELQGQFDQALAAAQNHVWTFRGKALAVSPQAYDRNAKTWGFDIKSGDLTTPYEGTVSVDYGQVADARAALMKMDTAIKAGALSAELDWGLRRDTATGRWDLMLRQVRLVDITDNAELGKTVLDEKIANVPAGKRAGAVGIYGMLNITTDFEQAIISINGREVGTGNWSGKVREGDYKVAVKRPDDYALYQQLTVSVPGGKTVSKACAGQFLKIGDMGPAGGIIFYDKGKVTDGWRFLETTPVNISNGVQWRNDGVVVVRDAKATGVGSGRSNTAAIVAAQGNGYYAAAFCTKLKVRGFQDWFLPSKDELHLMYENLKKTGLVGFIKGIYWSSSQEWGNGVWFEDFGDGNRSRSSTDYKGCVRPVRAF